MRFLDIAVASAYAAICLAIIVAINPIAPREAAVEAAAQTRLDSAISSYIEEVGLPFLTTSSAMAVCSSAAEASNSSLVFDVFVQGHGCDSVSAPSHPLAYSSLALSLPGRQVVIEVWLARQ